jgi:hypothetical protein
MNGSSPDVVAGAIHDALTAKRPRTRYRVGKHATLLPWGLHPNLSDLTSMPGLTPELVRAYIEA